jgi:transposase, IS30 family
VFQVKKKKKYTHLSSEERVLMSVLHAKQTSIGEIARELKRSKSTISRELNRPTTVFYRGTYLGESSQKNYTRKWKSVHKRKRLKSPIVEKYVLERLRLYWSPELIAGRIKKDLNVNISYEAIYQYIYDGKRDLVRYLPRKHLARKRIWQYRKRRKSNIKNRVDIDFRPKEANERKEFGHFEADTVISKRESSSALLVIADRKTRLTKIRKLTRKTSSQANSQIIFALNEYNVSQIHSITYDNGTEFCGHEFVNKTLQTKSYFCKAYHAWEKGTVENINGLIRRFFPKKTDFDTITEKEIEFMENWINNRPMKILKFKTPLECYLESTVPLTC